MKNKNNLPETRIKMKETCDAAVEAIDKLVIELNKLDPREFVTRGSKFHK